MIRNYIFVAFFFCFQTAVSQTNGLFAKFNDTSQVSVSIDFKLVNNLIVIPLQINSSDTLFFILDTGVRPTLLTSFTDTIDFKTADSTTIRGLGEGEDLTVWHTFDNIILLKDITLTKQNVYVLERDKFKLSEKMGMTINGIIGFSIFNNFVIEIDYERERLTISNPQKFKYKRKHENWIRMPLRIYNGKPYTQLKISLNKDTTILVDLLIDLGASDAIWLFPNSNDSIIFDSLKSSYYLGQGLNGDIYGYQGMIYSVEINKRNVLKNVTVSYPDPAGLQVPDGYDIKGRNGSIGSEIFRRFDLIIDYSNNLILLNKNSSFKDDFNFDLSGIEIIAPFVNLRYYKIIYVQQDSPAYKAGLEADDVILKINNLSVSHYSLNEILLVLRTKIGKKVKFLVERNGEEIETTLILENYRLD